MTINAEEIESDLKGFLQPINGFKSALDHIIRANNNPADSPEYKESNLDKALGHIYRAFFDTADWLGMNYHLNILKELKPYNVDTITKALPDYYSDTRPTLLELRKQIADLRNNKDIAQDKELIINEVDAYSAIVEHLMNIYKNVVALKPSLEEIKRKNRRSGFLTKYIIPIGAAFLGAVLGFFLSKWI